MKAASNAGGNEKPIGIVIVDDHPIVRRGLAQLMDQEKDLQVCGEASTAAEAQRVVAEARPDMVVIDVSLGDTNGVELTRTLREAGYKFPILLLSMHDEALYAERALRAGANGYIMKVEPAEKLLAAIREVCDGELAVSPKIASRLLRGYLRSGGPEDERRGIQRLSDRELEVFEMLGHGLSTREIAAKLKLGIKTIETHRTHIKQKLKLKNATELLQHAVHWVANGSYKVADAPPAAS